MIHGRLLRCNWWHGDYPGTPTSPQHLPDILVPEPLRHGRPKRAQLYRIPLVLLHDLPRAFSSARRKVLIALELAGARYQGDLVARTAIKLFG